MAGPLEDLLSASAVRDGPGAADPGRCRLLQMAGRLTLARVVPGLEGSGVPLPPSSALLVYMVQITSAGQSSYCILVVFSLGKLRSIPQLEYQKVEFTNILQSVITIDGHVC
jgi:hypothetical protein